MSYRNHRSSTLELVILVARLGLLHCFLSISSKLNAREKANICDALYLMGNFNKNWKELL